MRFGDGGLGIFQYSPAIAKPPETQALAKLATAESRRSGLNHPIIAAVHGHLGTGDFGE